MAAASVALLGRTSEFARCRTRMKDDIEFVGDTTQQNIDAAISQVESKTSHCVTPVSPCSTMTRMTSLVTSAATASWETSGLSLATALCETSRLLVRRTSKPYEDDHAAIQLPCPVEDGIEFGSDDELEEQHEVRLPFMRLRTDSGIGMPVWDPSISPASQASAYIAHPGDEESAVDTTVMMPLAMYSDSWSFSMPVPPASMLSPAMLVTSPYMSAVSPVMPPLAMPPTMAPFVPLFVSPNGDGHGYGGQAYNQARSNADYHGYDGHGHGNRAYSQQVSSTPQLQQSRKRTCKVHTARGAELNTCSPTTICFRNLPNNYSTNMVLELLDQNGFKESYDFVYLPHDFKRLPSLVNVGYFFVNFITHEIAVSALDKLVGFRSWAMLSTKVLEGSWAAKTQGKNACRERCKYFTFMHEDIPAECKPMMFERGVTQR